MVCYDEFSTLASVFILLKVEKWAEGEESGIKHKREQDAEDETINKVSYSPLPPCPPLTHYAASSDVISSFGCNFYRRTGQRAPIKWVSLT